MVRWLLNHLSSAALMLLTVGSAVTVGLVGEAVQRRRRVGPPHSNEMLKVTVEFVGLAYAILIGFVMVSLWQDQADAREVASSEASALHDIVSISRGLPTRDASRVGAAVRGYCDSVVGEEWGRLRDGSASQRTQVAAEGILRAVTAIETTDGLQTTLQSSMVESYKEFTGLRTERLALANVRLAGELWLLVLLASVLMIVLVAAFESEGKWHIGATVVIAATIGMVLFAIIALSYPFSGDVSVSAHPFIDVARSTVGLS